MNDLINLSEILAREQSSGQKTKSVLTKLVPRRRNRKIATANGLEYKNFTKDLCVKSEI
jgi:hypothetical protein